MTYQGDIIWVIGASSGIGAALAQKLSAQGATLAISARREAALQDTAEQLSGPHSLHPMDINDLSEVKAVIQDLQTTYGRIDRVIFMAAAYEPMTLQSLDIERTAMMINTNILGAFHLIHAVLPSLCAQSKAQIALCASVAGFLGLPGGQPYSATKAAIINLAQSLHAELPPHIDVKLINPGFVSTQLTEKNDFDMPFILTPEQAAIQISKDLKTSSFESHFPKRFTYMLKFLRLLPYAISLKLLKYMRKDNA